MTRIAPIAALVLLLAASAAHARDADRTAALWEQAERLTERVESTIDKARADLDRGLQRAAATRFRSVVEDATKAASVLEILYQREGSMDRQSAALEMLGRVRGHREQAEDMLTVLEQAMNDD